MAGACKLRNYERFSVAPACLTSCPTANMPKYSGDRFTPAVRERMGMAAKAGSTKTSLANLYKTERETVARWEQEAYKRNPCWTDAHRSGRPRKLDVKERSSVRRQARSRQNVQRITTSLNKKRAEPVSSSTVRRALVAGKTPLQWLPVNRGRKLSDKNMTQRLQFCLDNESAQTGAWIFGDSKFFYLYQDGDNSQQWAWQDPAKKLQVSSCSNPTVMHLYAIVAKGHKSELFFTAPTPALGTKAKKNKLTFTADRFIEVAEQLHKTIKAWGKDSARNPLVLDRARQHTAKKAKAAIASMGLHLKEGYPAQSWDLNIIENVWGVLETKLRQQRGRFPKSADGWRKRIRKAWAAIDQSTIDKLVDSVKGRIAGVKDLEGAWLYKHGSKGR
jgi:transposase